MNSELVTTIKEHFIKAFTSNPKIVFSPGRINLIGEHTDYNEGFVFPAAIDLGIYLAISPSTTNRSTLIALDVGEQYTFSASETLQPLSKNGWENYVLGIVAELQKIGKEVPNFNAVFSGDIPTGAGLSSSAALENAIVLGLNTLFNLELTKVEMIFISQKAEHNFVGVQCGIMDQYASMFGQKNKALHLDCRSLQANVYPVDLGAYELILINTNVKHALADSVYNERRIICEKIAKALNVKALRDVSESDIDTIASQLSEDAYYKAIYIVQENKRTLNAVTSLLEDDVKMLGNLLFASHKGLSEHYKVSTIELDFLVNQAKQSDAVIGARMMGGGFGGCTINIIDTSKKNTFLTDLQQKYRAKFNKDCTIYNVNLDDGTRLIEE